METSDTLVLVSAPLVEDGPRSKEKKEGRKRLTIGDLKLIIISAIISLKFRVMTVV